MSNSAKRDRLVASACGLFHRQGVHGTTIAEIAEAADVPLGNVYYYFKTRDDLVRAAIDARAHDARSLLASFESRSSPPARLQGLVRSWADVAELVAAHGCPIGTLCSELGKREDDLAGYAAQVIRVVHSWAEAQFREMGRHQDANELATALLAAVQGAALLTNALRDPAILTHEVRRLEQWIGSLA